VHVETSIPNGSASGELYRISILTREVKGEVDISKNGRLEVVSMISAGRTISPWSSQAFGALILESDIASSKTT